MRPYIRRVKMAQFTRVNGDFKQVMNYDSSSYTAGAVNAVTSGVTVQPQGPKLDFFAVIVKNTSAQAQDLRNQLGNANGGGTGVFNPGAVNQINQAVQRTSTIAVYQVEADTSGQISYAIYPSGAYTAATLQATIQGLGTITVTEEDGTTNTLDVSGSTVTNVGMKLATS